MATVCKAPARTPRKARPTGEAFSAQAAVERAMQRIPTVMAKLAE